MEFIPIRFAKFYKGYVPGDVTARPRGEADLLVERGYAVYAEVPKPKISKEVEMPPVDKQVKKPRIKKGK